MLDYKIAFFLAWRSLTRGSKLITSLIILILSLAFTNLIFIDSLLNGVTHTLNSQVIDNATGNIVISPQEEPSKRNYITQTQKIRGEIQTLPGVTATVQHYNLRAAFSYDKQNNGQYKNGSWPVIGVDPAEEPTITQISQNMIEGRYLDEGSTDEIILGADIAGTDTNGGEVGSLGGVNIGDKVSLNFSGSITKKYTIVGIFKTKSTFVDQNAYITGSEAQSILQVSSDQASQILVKINAEGTEEWYLDKISQMAPNLKVRKWTEHASTLTSVPGSFDLVATLIGVVGLFVATTTIFILIYVNTVNKRRQIGILKAIGIKEKIIIASYIFQAVFYVVFGVIFGTALLFLVITPHFVNHPITLAIGDVSLVPDKTQIAQSMLSLFFIALLSGFVPAWKAANENILDAIWGK